MYDLGFEIRALSSFAIILKRYIDRLIDRGLL